jgi:hypothetical protein
MQEALGIAQITKDTGLSRQTIYRIKDDPAGSEAALAAWGMSSRAESRARSLIGCASPIRPILAAMPEQPQLNRSGRMCHTTAGQRTALSGGFVAR